MKIFLLDYHNSLDMAGVTFTSDVNEFYDNFLEQHYDILVANFDFYSYVREFDSVYDGYIILLCEYSNELLYKRALEFADYCYAYSEFYKLKHRLDFLKRKIYKTRGAIFKYRDLLYNFNTKTLYLKSQSTQLTKAQQELLEVLIKNRDNYTSSESIINICEYIGSIGSIKVIISTLRKLGFDIISKQNLGYKLKEA
jgi:DNA-binding response OmpR family regulator